MQRRNANFILTNGYMDGAYTMAQVLNEVFTEMNISGTAKAYYEDWYVHDAVLNSDGIEYGVQVVTDGLSSQDWSRFLEAVYQFLGNYYEVVVREE